MLEKEKRIDWSLFCCRTKFQKVSVCKKVSIYSLMIPYPSQQPSSVTFTLDVALHVCVTKRGAGVAMGEVLKLRGGGTLKTRSL